jgi:ABC-type bacteriocin/lantibiotic exporter with double-glycine peptidase domain
MSIVSKLHLLNRKAPHGALLFLLLLFQFGCQSMASKDALWHTNTPAGFAGRLLSVEPEKQLNDEACGAAVLASTLHYWHTSIDQAELLRERPPGAPEHGYSLAELKEMAKANHFAAFAYRSDLKDIKHHLDAGRPVIVALLVDSTYINDSGVLGMGLGRWVQQMLSPSYHHYVVVMGYDERQLVLMDPVLGIKSIQQTDFLRHWQKLGSAALLVAKAG